MKTDTSIPLVGHPEQIAGPRQWPNVAADHSLPVRHAVTEATVSAAIMAVCGGAALVVLAAPLAFVAFLAFAVALMWLVMFLRRYEDHVSYVRSDRAPAVLPDLDADGKPDAVYGVWYGNGAPPSVAGSLDNVYRRRFAEFCAACRAGDTSVRYLRSSGFDDGLQALFRGWLMQYQAANWVSSAGHNQGWELGEEEALRRVLRNTAWAEEQ